MTGMANTKMYGVLQASATLRSKCVEHHTYKMKDITWKTSEVLQATNTTK